jgi:ankyrin repeat protein
MLNATQWCGASSIEKAIHCGDNDEVVTALIELGANATFNEGEHVRYAAEWGRARVCGALIRGGVNVNLVDQRGETFLHVAAKAGQLEVCKVLVASGANVGAVDRDDITAAARARYSGRQEVAEYLDGLSGVPRSEGQQPQKRRRGGTNE